MQTDDQRDASSPGSLRAPGWPSRGNRIQRMQDPLITDLILHPLPLMERFRVRMEARRK